MSRRTARPFPNSAQARRKLANALKRQTPEAPEKHAAAMQRFFQQHDPQGAAEYLAALRGIEQDNAMRACEAAGFQPEYYNDSIRVHFK